MNELEYKYVVNVERREKAKRVDPNTKAALQQAGMINAHGKLKIPGISAKMLKIMKMEYVNCPVLDREIQFVQCYVCANFRSRINSAVRCLGENLEPADDSVSEENSSMVAAALKMMSDRKSDAKDADGGS